MNQHQTRQSQTQSVNPKGLPQRKTIRLNGYDYSQAGLYFITVCAQNKLCLFGTIENGTMMLNNAGNMIQRQWQELTNHFYHIRLHEFIIMPNHFHGIVEIVGVPLVGTRDAGEPPLVDQRSTEHKTPKPRATTRDCPYVNTRNTGRPPTIGHMIGVFKSLTTNDYIWNVKQNSWQRFNKRLWQRNYYEHIIRDEKAYFQLSEYIQTNPQKWMDDKYYEER